MGRARTANAVAALAVALAIAHTWRFRWFVTDDAFISFRYAARFADGLGLTWNDGERVEGYSDLLWVLFSAGGHALGADQVIVARALGCLGFALAVAAASIDPSTLRFELKRALGGGLPLAACGGLAAWAMGGLEQTFLAGLVAVSVIGLVRLAERRSGRGELAALAALLAAITLTRDDAILLVGGGLFGAAVAGAPLGRLVGVGLGPLLAIVGQEAFRLSYYGDWVSNSARVKVSLTAERARMGAVWTLEAVAAHAVLVLGAVASAFGASPARRAIPFGIALSWWSWVAFSGGDLFSAWRQFLPALPAMAFLVGDGVARIRWTRFRVGLAAVAGAAHVVLANHPSGLDHALDIRWEWGAKPLGEVAAAAWGARRPLLAVDAAGALPYWSGLPALDLLGLTDRWTAMHPPPGAGGRGLGHDLGDPKYVWSRAPDILVFNWAGGVVQGAFTAGKSLQRRRDFGARYRPVRIEVASPAGGVLLTWWYVRFDAGPLGRVQSRDRIEIPAWFLSSEATPARWTGDALAVEVTAERAGRLRPEPFPPGHWAPELPPGTTGALLCPTGEPQPAPPEGLVVDGKGGPYGIDLRAEGPAVSVESIAWTRVERPVTARCGAL
jgi:hypothetical protein